MGWDRSAQKAIEDRYLTIRTAAYEHVPTEVVDNSHPLAELNRVYCLADCHWQASQPPWRPPGRPTRPPDLALQQLDMWRRVRELHGSGHVLLNLGDVFSCSPGTPDHVDPWNHLPFLRQWTAIGSIYLIPGNHDVELDLGASDAEGAIAATLHRWGAYIEAGWKIVRAPFTVTYVGIPIVVDHVPPAPPEGGLSLHGHVHEYTLEDPHYMNVCPDPWPANGYYPVRTSTVLDQTIARVGLSPAGGQPLVRRTTTCQLE